MESNCDKYHPDHDPKSIKSGRATVPFNEKKGVYCLPGGSTTADIEKATFVAKKMDEIISRGK